MVWVAVAWTDVMECRRLKHDCGGVGVEFLDMSDTMVGSFYSHWRSGGSIKVSVRTKVGQEMQRVNGRKGVRTFRMPMGCIEFVTSDCMLRTTEVDNSV